jgi:hypothetical protein
MIKYEKFKFGKSLDLKIFNHENVQIFKKCWILKNIEIKKFKKNVPTKKK